jgi:hypothetical protein
MQSEDCQRATKNIKQKKNNKLIPVGGLDPILNPKENKPEESVTNFNAFYKNLCFYV